MRDEQRRVREFVAAHKLEAPAQARLLDVVAELGELAKEVLEATGYGRRPNAQMASAALELELGDLAFALLALADGMDFDLARCLDLAIAKYEKRLVAHGTAARRLS